MTDQNTPPADDVREAPGLADKIRELDAAERTARDFSTDSLPRWAKDLIEASRALLEALPLPGTPADDVREALARVIRISDFRENDPLGGFYSKADAILAAFVIYPRRAGADAEVIEALRRTWVAHRATARNGWSGCTCGEENPGRTVNLNGWYETHLLSSMAAAFEFRPRGTVTDAEVAAALDARATMSTRHIFLYATERCRCGEEWSDAHWMRFILEAAREVQR